MLRYLGICAEDPESCVMCLYRAGSGHYTAMCRVRGVWCRFDDQSVSVCTEEEVLATQAYLLLYLRGDLVDDIKEGSA